MNATYSERAARTADVAEGLAEIDYAFGDAIGEMQAIRSFVDAREHILGSDNTKHGEIAEHVTVGVRRARDALEGRAPTATFEGVGRIDAVDYVFDGMPVQSKYSSSLPESLDRVLDHYQQHSPDHIRYHVPVDQQAQLDELRATGAIEGFSLRQVANIREQVDELELLTGHDSRKLIQSGEATYAEVQLDSVDQALTGRIDELEVRAHRLKEQVRTDPDHTPSVDGLVQVAALGAVAGGGVRVAQALFVKYRQGKNPFKGEFTAQDWTEVGVALGNGVGAGTVTGGALYLLTNAAHLAAPFAGSLVSAVVGVGSLLRSYRTGIIDGGRLVGLSHLVAGEAAIVGLAAAAGQAVIPIPMLGAFVGSIAGKIVGSALIGGLERERDMVDLPLRLTNYEQRAATRLDIECRALMARLDDHFGELDRLAKLAPDPDTNSGLQLRASARLAHSVNVPDEAVLHSVEEVDAFMTN